MSLRQPDIQKPKVTIGLPVYNGQRFLEAALDSALAQTFGDFEVVISDNASNDDTSAICRAYCQRDSRVRYFRQEANIGAIANFAFVAGQAEGQYLTFLACDDLLLAEYLSKTVPVLESTPHLALVACGINVTDEAGNCQSVERLDFLSESLPWKLRLAKFFEYPSSGVVYCIYGLMRPKFFQEAMRTMPKGAAVWGHDVITLARIASAGEIVSVPDVLRVYRWHKLSVSGEISTEIAKSPLCYRICWRFMMSAKIRADLISVLLRSKIPLAVKMFCLRKAVLQYVAASLREKLTLPKRAFLLLSGRRKQVAASQLRSNNDSVK